MSRRRLLAGRFAALLTVACAPVEGPPPGLPPEPALAEPAIRVALRVADLQMDVGGGHALVLRDSLGVPVLELPEGVAVQAVRSGDRIALRLEDVSVGPFPMVAITPRDSAGLVRIRGREYRGTVQLWPSGPGVVVVNRLGMEAYLAGVINAEMGRRAVEDSAALSAQAIVSRTFALLALGRPRAPQYDVLATVADQAYGGVGAELSQGWDALRATRGQVLTYEGRPIEAFFHSTCGGRTAAGEEVFVNGGLPYLRSVSDASPDGTSWCARSPRYRWAERWTAAALEETLRHTLPPLGTDRSRISELEDVTVTAYTPSGRVSGLGFRFRGGTVPVSGSPAVRQVLRPAPGGGTGDLLRSASFRIVLGREGGRLVRVTADGGGAGHGVGFCQWGAVGRSRAGATATGILAAYFPGTSIERRW